MFLSACLNMGKGKTALGVFFVVVLEIGYGSDATSVRNSLFLGQIFFRNVILSPKDRPGTFFSSSVQKAH